MRSFKGQVAQEFLIAALTLLTFSLLITNFASVPILNKILEKQNEQHDLITSITECYKNDLAARYEWLPNGTKIKLKGNETCIYEYERQNNVFAPKRRPNTPVRVG